MTTEILFLIIGVAAIIGCPLCMYFSIKWQAENEMGGKIPPLTKSDKLAIILGGLSVSAIAGLFTLAIYTFATH